MTNSKNTPGPTDLSVAVAPVRRRHRELIEAVAAWLADRARPVDPDQLALICAGAEQAHRFTAEPASPTRWTRLGVYQVLRCDIPNWCATHRCVWPERLSEIMWAWFDALHALGRLDPGSDPVAELRKPLACYGWLDQDGNRMSLDAARQLPCECLLPFRETTELLGELVRLCERVGEDPVDRLRWLVGRPTRWPLAGARLTWLASEELVDLEEVPDPDDLADPTLLADPLDLDDLHGLEDRPGRYAWPGRDGPISPDGGPDPDDPPGSDPKPDPDPPSGPHDQPGRDDPPDPGPGARGER